MDGFYSGIEEMTKQQMENKAKRSKKLAKPCKIMEQGCIVTNTVSVCYYCI